MDSNISNGIVDRIKRRAMIDLSLSDCKAEGVESVESEEYELRRL